MQGIGISKRWRLVGFVAIIAAILSLGAIACSSDDDEDGGDATATQESDAERHRAEDASRRRRRATRHHGAWSTRSRTCRPAQPGGLTTITLDNIGGEDHQVQLVKLNEGVTFEQFQRSAEVRPERAPQRWQGRTRGGRCQRAVARRTRVRSVTRPDRGQLRCCSASSPARTMSRTSRRA